MLHSTPLPHTINGKLRDELLNGEIFYTLKEAQVLTEQWRKEYRSFYLTPSENASSIKIRPNVCLVPQCGSRQPEFQVPQCGRRQEELNG